MSLTRVPIRIEVPPIEGTRVEKLDNYNLIVADLLGDAQPTGAFEVKDCTRKNLQTLCELKPELSFTVKDALSPDGGEMKIELKFDRHPRFWVADILKLPKLKQLTEVLGALKSLQVEVLTDSGLRQALSAVLDQKREALLAAKRVVSAPRPEADETAQPDNDLEPIT